VETLTSSWASGKPVDIAHEMNHLTLDIIGRTLLGVSDKRVWRNSERMRPGHKIYIVYQAVALFQGLVIRGAKPNCRGPFRYEPCESRRCPSGPLAFRRLVNTIAENRPTFRRRHSGCANFISRIIVKSKTKQL
jgi:cytochrome P450